MGENLTPELVLNASERLQQLEKEEKNSLHKVPKFKDDTISKIARVLWKKRVGVLAATSS